MELENMKKIARKAGKIALRYFRKLDDKQIQQKSNDYEDPVTIADIEISNMLKEEMRSFPDVCLLSEESIDDFSPEPKQPLLVVDELDGTAAFSKGIESFCHMLCYFEYSKENKEYEPLVSVIYDPVRDIMYWAEKGKGAYKDKKKIHVGDGKEFLYGNASHTDDKIFNKRYSYLIEHHNKFNPRYNISTRGNLGLLAMTLAEGKAHVLSFLRAANWDYAAAILIVREAGGEAYLTRKKEFLKKPVRWTLQLDNPGEYYPTIITNGKFDMLKFYENI